MCKSLTIFFNLIVKHWNLFKTPFEFLWQFCFNRWFWSLLVLSYFVVGNDYVKPKSYSWHCECLSFHGPLGHQLITHGYLSNRPTASVIHQNMIIYTEKQLSKSVLFFFFFWFNCRSKISILSQYISRSVWILHTAIWNWISLSHNN